MELNMNEVWKTIAVVCLGVIATGSGSWLMFGRDSVSRSDLERYVTQQSPWVGDRALIQRSVESNAESIAKLDHSIVALIQSQQSLTVQMEVLITRFEGLLERKDK